MADRTPIDKDGGRWSKGWCDRGFHVLFGLREKLPLTQEDVLGLGSSGAVSKTVCKGIALAWKTKRIPVEGIDQEIATLKKLHHRHLVRLEGSYTHRQMLGLLLSPVAKCDLAAFIKYLDIFKSTETILKIRQRDDGQEAIYGFEKLGIEIIDSQTTVHKAQTWLRQRFQCLANAIQYLHHEGIKHKDLKPSNILLDADGVYISDFGSSTDFSGLTTSNTNNTTYTTRKYCGPELLQGLKSTRRSFDIFSLGCVFLEMFISSMTNEALQTVIMTRLQSRNDGDYLYRDHLPLIRKWAAETVYDSIVGQSLSVQQLLLWMILQMLDEDPARRLTADQTVMSLSYIDGLRKKTELPLHRPCCTPIVGNIYIALSEKDAKEPTIEAVEVSRNPIKTTPLLDKQEKNSVESVSSPPLNRSDIGTGQNYNSLEDGFENHQFEDNASDREEPRTHESPSLARPFNSPPNTHVRPSTSQSRRDLDIDCSRASETILRPIPVPQTIPHANCTRRTEAHERSDSSGNRPPSAIAAFMHSGRQLLHNTTEPEDAPPVYEQTTTPYNYHAS